MDWSKVFVKSSNLRHRRVALNTVKYIIAREGVATRINPDTLNHCADRIALVEGESESVKLLRRAAVSDRATAYALLKGAFGAAKIEGKARHGGDKSKPKRPDTAEDILERLSMSAANPPGAFLCRLGTGALAIFEGGQRIPKSAEVLGYYDIRADARDMLADIKEAMA